jgi:hypothetical protein
MYGTRANGGATGHFSFDQFHNDQRPRWCGCAIVRGAIAFASPWTSRV